MLFEWDAAKDAANRRKHGVGFDEARSVFSDPEALLMADPDHSQVEERYLLLGASWRRRLLVVVHCERAHGSGELVLRIISARKSTTAESGQYRNRRMP